MKKKPKIDTKTRALIGISIISIILITSLIYKINQNKKNYNLQQSNHFDMSLYQLTDHVQNVENFLAKSTISSSSESGAETLTHVWKEADIAVSYLSQIPLNLEQLNKTAKFLNQVSEYSYSLSRKNIYKENLNQQDLDNLKKLHQYSVELKDSLQQMEEQISLGQITWQQLQENQKQNYTRQVDNIDDITFVDIDNNFNEFEGLIYDGAFSEHIELQDKKGLPDAEVTEEQAEEEVKKILKDKIKTINKKGKITQGNIPVYQFEIIDQNQETTNIAISIKGGKLVQLNKNREVIEQNLSKEEANQKAKDYLAAIGFENMQESYYLIHENIITINYLYKQDNILIYPDLIKIKIALDNGEILGVETNGYLNSHIQRIDITPQITETQAKTTLNPKLEIQSSALAIIPTEWKTEILCYEFKGIIEDKEFLIYINADTLVTEKIYILLDTPGGTLAI